MHQYKLIAIYGFTIFAMFFGSGNLVFPLEVGYNAHSSWLYSFLGFFLTGIILPFLGLFVIKLHKGNYYNFFNEAGSIAKYLIPLVTLSLLGSFGVVPRCITVAHGGIAYIYPEISLWFFALIFCITSFILCLNDHLVVKILGKWLSPILLFALLSLIIVGVNNSPELTAGPNKGEAFINGFFKGYQLMDLFAAFFFSAFIFKQLQTRVPPKTSDKDIIIFAIKASIVGSMLLSMIYLGLVFLGAHYAFLLENVSPEYMLPTIAKHLMGNFTVLFLSIPVVLSCLTTAIALNNIYARYLCSLLRLNQNKFPLILGCTTFIAFLISLLDFNAIASFLALALSISYPSLIMLTIMGIIFKDRHHKLKTWSFWLITLIAIVC